MEEEEKYRELQHKVEKIAGRKMGAPRDFDYLSLHILDRTRLYIAPITLKRFWGYLGENNRKKPFRNTLNTLAIYAGYTSFDAFEKSLTGDEIICSNYLQNQDVLTAALRIGTRIELKWAPDRCVTIEYEGYDMFRVIESLNSKLMAGDTFHCYHFINNQPLYLRCLIQGDNLPCGYVCGKTGGIQFRILN